MKVEQKNDWRNKYNNIENINSENYDVWIWKKGNKNHGKTMNGKKIKKNIQISIFNILKYRYWY